MNSLKWTIVICLVAVMSILIYRVAAVDCVDAKWAFYEVQKGFEYERNTVKYFEALEGDLHGASKTLAASAKKRQYNIIQDLLRADAVVNALCDQPRAD